MLEAPPVFESLQLIVIVVVTENVAESWTEIGVFTTVVPP
jgi:hypothetical protein